MAPDLMVTAGFADFVCVSIPDFHVSDVSEPWRQSANHNYHTKLTSATIVEYQWFIAPGGLFVQNGPRALKKVISQ